MHVGSLLYKSFYFNGSLCSRPATKKSSLQWKCHGSSPSLLIFSPLKSSNAIMNAKI